LNEKLIRHNDWHSFLPAKEKTSMSKSLIWNSCFGLQNGDIVHLARNPTYGYYGNKLYEWPHGRWSCKKFAGPLRILNTTKPYGWMKLDCVH
jgi:hypothetical protein